MRVVLQRVRQAAVDVAGETVGAIGPGLLALVAVAPADGPAEVAWMADKLVHLRIFPDDAGKMNRSVLDAGGSLLLVSQFTLYGDCRKGRRPSFVDAALPGHAEPLCAALAAALRERGVPVATGRFGADMQVALLNDGPVTLVIDTPPRG